MSAMASSQEGLPDKTCADGYCRHFPLSKPTPAPVPQINAASRDDGGRGCNNVSARRTTRDAIRPVDSFVASGTPLNAGALF